MATASSSASATAFCPSEKNSKVRLITDDRTRPAEQGSAVEAFDHDSVAVRVREVVNARRASFTIHGGGGPSRAGIGSKTCGSPKASCGPDWRIRDAR
jgi:hypothetical protein